MDKRAEVMIKFGYQYDDAADASIDYEWDQQEEITRGGGAGNDEDCCRFILRERRFRKE